MANIGDQLLQPEEGWQRIEDNDPKILYSGSTWQTSKDANYVTGTTMHYTGNESDAYIKFKFFGSKIRLISQVGKQFHPNDDSVIIDDIEYIINSYSLHDTYNSKVIEFEKLDLNNDIHNVIIKAGSNASHTLCLDAIDIDKDGYMITNLGCQLLQPEAGWQRIDNVDSKIVYDGNWTVESNISGNYNNTSYYGNAIGLMSSFKFKGTKLRIIGATNTDKSDKIEITIDDIKYTFSEYNSSLMRSILVFEKTELSDCIHTVTIKNVENKYIQLDAIDINENGYTVASPGCQLLQPEAGWQRIDDTHPYIKYTGDWSIDTNSNFYKSSCHYTISEGASCEFKFRGTKLRLCTFSHSARDLPISVYIDNNCEQYYTNIKNGQFYILVYEKLGLENKEHDVKIVFENSGANLNQRCDIDCIDIDEDGYMVASPGCQLLQPEEGWKRIDDSDPAIVFGGTWDRLHSTQSGYTACYTTKADASIKFRFYGTSLRIIAGTGPSESNDIQIIIDGNSETYSCNSGESVYVLLYEKTGIENTVHTVEILSGTTPSTCLMLECIDINEDGRLLTEEEYESMLNKHIIKSDGKFYTIEENNLVEIAEVITPDLIKNRGVSVTTLTANQSLLPDKFKLISYKDNTFNIRSTKSHKELIVASNDFATTIQSHTDFFDVVGISDFATSIKVAFSIDNGITWKTYDTDFKDLSITIPLKPYNELTEEELNQWNNARDIISEQGIDITNLSKIDFNTLNMKKIRFAYVLSINSKDNKCCASQLKWQFDSKGTMKSMTSDELEIELLQDSIKIVPRVSSDMIKINFTNGSNDGSGSSSDINLTDEEIDTIVQEITE